VQEITLATPSDLHDALVFSNIPAFAMCVAGPEKTIQLAAPPKHARIMITDRTWSPARPCRAVLQDCCNSGDRRDDIDGFKVTLHRPFQDCITYMVHVVSVSACKEYTPCAGSACSNSRLTP
jgi:hypothetical protein